MFTIVECSPGVITEAGAVRGGASGAAAWGVLTAGIAACLWVVMWVVTGLGLWVKRGFEEEGR